MELSLIVLKQVIILFILIGIGFVLTKTNKLSDAGVKQMTNILLTVVTPCVLIEAYQKEFDVKLLKSLLLAFLYSIIIHIINIIISHFLFKKEESNKYRVSRFASNFSNCGYMAIPLLGAALGSNGIFFGSAYLVVFTIFYWTYGIYICTEDKKALTSIKNILINPGIIGVTVGLILFFAKIKLPEIVLSSISYMASLNTPIPMIILGSFLVKVDFKAVFKNMRVYLVSFVRLILIPIIGIFITKLLNLSTEVATSVLIVTACPVATVTSLFASKYELDTTYAAQVVSFSTILSIITIPLMVILGGII